MKTDDTAQVSTRLRRMFPIFLFALSALGLALVSPTGPIRIVIRGIIDNILAPNPVVSIEFRPISIMQVVVTLMLGGTSIVVILAKRYGPKDKHWAYATLGTILGY